MPMLDTDSDHCRQNNDCHVYVIANIFITVTLRDSFLDSRTDYTIKRDIGTFIYKAIIPLI